MSEVLKEKTRQRLVTVQRELAGDYVYFEAVFDDGIIAGLADAPDGLAREDLFDFFREIELFPFARLDLSYAPHDADGRLNIDETLSMLKMFMETLIMSQPQEFWEESLFEIAHSKPVDNTSFMECYALMYSLIKSFSRRLGVGLFLFDGSKRANYDALEERLILCGKGHCDPDFVTIDADPGNGRAQIEKVRHIINDSGAMAMKIYAEERNDPSQDARLEYGDNISGVIFRLGSE
jgi:hypothetical protein